MNKPSSYVAMIFASLTLWLCFVLPAPAEEPQPILILEVSYLDPTRIVTLQGVSHPFQAKFYQSHLYKDGRVQNIISRYGQRYTWEHFIHADFATMLATNLADEALPSISLAGADETEHLEFRLQWNLVASATNCASASLRTPLTLRPTRLHPFRLNNQAKRFLKHWKAIYLAGRSPASDPAIRAREEHRIDSLFGDFESDRELYWDCPKY